MNGNESQKSFGELPTWGHQAPAGPEGRPEGLSWSEREMSQAETLRPTDGIRDDGRTDAARRWKTGEEILDRYMVERELGQGGMGVVYGCLDKVGGVPVAVKCLPPELGHNSVEMEEVRENFELVYGLGHPNIAAVKTLERDARGEYYLVMERVEGDSLRAWLRRRWKAGGVPLAEAIPILRQVAAALDYAHRKKVVHRDVKPGNVMIDARTGEVKVLDFGLAAQIRTSLSRASHACRGTSGTGPYMAPEQWLGKHQDGAADQYALGVMAYEMLAGHLPFENSELAVLKDAVLHGTADPVPGLPKGAMAALRRAMAKRKEKRFGSCTEFVEALAGERYAGSGRGGRLGWVAALALAAGVGGGVWWWEEHVKDSGRLERVGDVVEKTARPEGSPHQRTAEEEVAEKRAEEERLAAEMEAQRLAEQREAEEEAKRLEEERKKAQREQAAREAAEAQRRAQEAEQRALEAEKAAEAAKQKAEEESERHQREWEEWLVKLFGQQASAPAAGTEAAEAARPMDPTQGELSIDLGNGVKLEMIHCPGVSPDFWMGKYEVTQEQWRQVMGWNRSHFGGKPKNPVETISWNDCQEFVTKINTLPAVRLGGLLFHLPTAEEWELACRAGAPESADYCELEGGLQVDETTLPRVARYAMGWNDGPVEAGSFQPNAWGLYDMHGNVWEWTQTADDGCHVLCGGGFYNEAVYCSAGIWVRHFPDDAFRFLGLRLAATGRVATLSVGRKGDGAASVPLDSEEKAVRPEGSPRQAGDTKTIILPGGATMEMVWCPPGSFMMGSPPGEEGRFDDEMQHQVTLTEGFWMAKTEVTQGQWNSVMGMTVQQRYYDYPKCDVSWEEAQEFCRRAWNGLQLPTEAQWEYACRAGSTGEYGGTGDLDGMGWYSGSSADPKRSEGPTHPVGQKQPNAWGLYDMHGNVWEWCADWYASDLGTHTVTNPKGPVLGSFHVCRGGCWADDARSCRSAFRGNGTPGYKHGVLGFRPVRVQP